MSRSTMRLALVGLALGLGGHSYGATGVHPAPAACDAAKVAGLWTGSRYSMEILADRSYRASGTPNMASIDVNGTIRIDACKVEIVDTSGKFACPSSAIGRYTFTVTDTALVFTLVSDSCDGRRISVTRGPLKRTSR